MIVHRIKEVPNSLCPDLHRIPGRSKCATVRQPVCDLALSYILNVARKSRKAYKARPEAYRNHRLVLHHLRDQHRVLCPLDPLLTMRATAVQEVSLSRRVILIPVADRGRLYPAKRDPSVGWLRRVDPITRPGRIRSPRRCTRARSPVRSSSTPDPPSPARSSARLGRPCRPVKDRSCTTHSSSSSSSLPTATCHQEEDQHRDHCRLRAHQAWAALGLNLARHDCSRRISSSSSSPPLAVSSNHRQEAASTHRRTLAAVRLLSSTPCTPVAACLRWARHGAARCRPACSRPVSITLILRPDSPASQTTGGRSLSPVSTARITDEGWQGARREPTSIYLLPERHLPLEADTSCITYFHVNRSDIHSITHGHSYRNAFAVVFPLHSYR